MLPIFPKDLKQYYYNIPGIYCIENTINNHKYIGGSKNLYKRFLDHMSALKRGNHENEHLQNAYNKYGSENFVFYRILECCDEYELLEWEQACIDYLKPEYNICKIAGKVVMTEDIKRKIGIANRGKYLAKPRFGGEKYVGARFKSPNGIVHVVTTCIHDFSRVNGLDSSTMIKLTKGLSKYKIHKGWTYVVT